MTMSLETDAAPAGLDAPRCSLPLEAAAIVELSPEALDAILGPEMRAAAQGISDWLIRHARDTSLAVTMIGQLCDRLVAIGVPLDRYGSSTEVLDAEHDAVARLWLRGQGVTERTYVRDGEDLTYKTSPFFETAETGRPVELWLPTTDDERFGIVAELKAEGFVHYICMPNVLMNGGHGWVTFATRRPTGFSRQDIAVLARILPAIAILIDIRSTWLSLDKLLRTYVGDEPHRAILRGNTKRGQVSTIRSAILFADMRNSVGYTIDLDAVSAVGVFNAFFDCIVPAIERRHGEVLKYIGDGLLAIFRDSKAGGEDAADRALAAATEALEVLQKRNQSHPAEPPIEAGMALHYGEAAYGNIGSGIRLDFTVIGKDVALASRIGGVNRTLSQPVLMSSAFVERLHGPSERVGVFSARGFKDPIEVFRPTTPRIDSALARHRVGERS